MKIHSWINWPNKATRKCTVCGCIYRYANDKFSYELNGEVFDKYIECKI